MLELKRAASTPRHPGSTTDHVLSLNTARFNGIRGVYSVGQRTWIRFLCLLRSAMTQLCGHVIARAHLGAQRRPLTSPRAP